MSVEVMIKADDGSFWHVPDWEMEAVNKAEAEDEFGPGWIRNPAALCKYFGPPQPAERPCGGCNTDKPRYADDYLCVDCRGKL